MVSIVQAERHSAGSVANLVAGPAHLYLLCQGHRHRCHYQGSECADRLPRRIQPHAAAHFWQNNVPFQVELATIAKLLGHSSIEQMLRYIGVDVGDMASAMT